MLLMRVRGSMIDPGQVALPGGMYTVPPSCDLKLITPPRRAGKASSLTESPQTTSLREAHEEIGLPVTYPLTPLCLLPLYLAKNFLGVRPCIFFLPPTQTPNALSTIRSWRSDPDEVAAVFDAPLRGFLDGMRHEGGRYEGYWSHFPHGPWRMHNFFVPVSTPATMYYKVWGMTARILVEAARIAYGTDPEFEYVEDFGDEELIARFMAEGKLGPKEGKKDEEEDDRKGLAAKI
jgi:peroxisomal coenzyme A diphosphatase NUDT7